MRKISYIITIINILFQIVCMIFGRMTYAELGGLNIIFYVFRPEYMVVSGIIAFINLFLLVATLIAIRKCRIYDVAAIIFNVEYIIFYSYFLRLQ